MDTSEALLLSVEFEAEIVHWRGPAPYLFAPVPFDHVDAVCRAAHVASYGWGCVPVTASIGSINFTTSLFPKDGGFLLPIKVAVQRATGVGLGDRVGLVLRIAAPHY